MKSIAWLDTNGCENGWHEIKVDDDGEFHVTHIDDVDCEVSECGINPDEVGGN